MIKYENLRTHVNEHNTTQTFDNAYNNNKSINTTQISAMWKRKKTQNIQI